MPRLNIEGYLVSYLGEELGERVCASVPDPRPRRLVVVERAGGSHDGALLDRAGVHLSVWAESKAEAFELADMAASLVGLLPDERFSDGFARAEEESFRYDPDPESGSPRYFISFTITTFRY